MSECPDESTVLHFTQGLLGPEEAARVEAHLDTCEDCRSFVAELVRSGSLGGVGPETPSFVDKTIKGTGPFSSISEELEAPDLQPGLTVGRYIILGKLGAGGMGVVYRAYDPELDRKLCLKLLRKVRDGRRANEARARLLREAQAMARLSHPNVVTVHDVGTFGDQVFVAMELLDGGTLTRWLRKEKRSWREVLEKVRRAGQGLAAAHRAGLVHRDFKPDNVLLGSDGGVRVTDFGLVSAIDAPNSAEIDAELNAAAGIAAALAAEQLTVIGELIGTPAYMSPEQLDGQPASAASDQFSFCITLYEALYGERPFEGSSVPELREAVLSQRVKPPPRGTPVPAALRRILLQGLSRDPEARFASMDVLLEALLKVERRRRRGWVAAGAMAAGFAAVLAVSFQANGRHALVCKGAERKLVGVWDDGRREAIRQAFLASGKPYAEDAFQSVRQVLDRYSTSWVTMHTDACEATQLRGEQSEQMLGLRMLCLERRLKDLGALTEMLAGADAEVVEKAVAASHALASLAGCANVDALGTRLPLPEDARARERVQQLQARLGVARSLSEAGKYAGALGAAKTVADEAPALRYPPLEAEALHELARAQQRQGDFKSAERTLYRALRAAEAGRDDVLAASVWVDLFSIVGVQLEDRALAERVEPLARGALERIGMDAALEARLLTAQGMMLFQQRKTAEAEAVHLKALALREKTFGMEHPDVAHSHFNLGNVYTQATRYEEAVAQHTRSAELYEKVFGPRHPSVASVVNNLGVAYSKWGQQDRALQAFERARQIAEAALVPDHPLVISIVANLCGTQAALGQWAEARRSCDDAMARATQRFGAAHKKIGQVLQDRGELERLSGHPAEAVPFFQRSLATYTQLPDSADKSEGLANALLGLGRAKLDLRRSREAAPVLDRALQLARTSGLDALHLANARFGLARALWDGRRDHKKAIQLAVQAVSDFKAAGAPGDEERAKAEAWLAARSRR